MRGEIRRKIKPHIETVISSNKQYVQRPEISKVLEFIRDKGTEAVDRRLIYEFTKMGLFDNDGSLTSDGKKAIEKGTVSMPEYGQYEFITISDDPWIQNSLLALKRNFAGHKQDKKNARDRWSPYNITYTEQKIFDYDMREYECIKLANTKSRLDANTKSLMMDCRVDYDSSDTEFFCDIAGQIIWRDDSNTDFSINRRIDIDFDALFSEIVPGYDSRKKVILLNSEPSTDEETLKMFRTVKDGHGTKDNYEYSYDLFDVPLRASDKQCAEKWMNRLRRLAWKDNFISKEQCYEDQEKWLETILPSGESIPLEGEELLKDVRGNRRVYWNVASMMDLVPDESELLRGFYIDENEEISQKLKTRIFTERVKKSFRDLYIIDSYANNNLLEVIRSVLPECEKITLFSDPDKYKNSKPKYREDKIDPLSPPKGIVYKELKGEHDRYLIIRGDTNRVWYWGVTNSFDKYQLKNGGLYSTSKVRFEPVTNVHESIRKIAEGK